MRMDPLKLEEAIQQYHEADSESHKYIRPITTALQNKDLLLSTLVENLGWLLSSEEKEKRNSGISLLVHVLQDAGYAILSGQEVESLATFFCSRLSDHHSLFPMTLQGLLFLSGFPGLKEDQAQAISRSIFAEVHVAAQLLEDRKKIYLIFCSLLDKHITGLQLMASEFLLSYIQIMDGERDPHCLMLAFRIVTILAKHFDLKENVEDLFDVVACYFPIDFRAPVEDAFGVTREELAGALEGCLASTSLFAPFCVPLILEKLMSDVESSKLDALSVLKRCALEYGRSTLKSHLQAVWSAVRREVFLGKDEALFKESLNCLTAVVSSLSEEDCESFMDTIWKECSSLMQGDSGLCIVSANVFKAAFSGTAPAHRKELLEKAIVHVTDILKEAEGPQRLEKLQAFAIIVDVPPVGPSGTWNISENCWSFLVSLLSLEETNGKLHNTSTFCWKITKGLLHLGSFLPEKEVVPFVQMVLTHVAHKNTNVTKTALIGTCVSLTQNLEEIAKIHFLPGLIELVPEVTLAGDILAVICASAPNIAGDFVLDPLMKRLSCGCTASELALCKCLESLTQSKEGNYHQYNLTEQYLCPMLEDAMLSVYQGSPDTYNRPLFSAIQAIVPVLSPVTGLQVVHDFLHVIISNLASTRWNKVKPVPFETLSQSSRSSLSQLICSVLPHLAPSSNVCTLQEAVRWLVSKSGMDNEDQHLAQTLAGLANKCSCCGQLAFELIHQLQLSRSVVLMIIWLTKALLLSGHPSTAKATDLLLRLLADPKHGQTVSREFEIILLPPKKVLKPSSHAKITLFYAQRFFHLTAPFLLKAYEEGTNESRRNFLAALCCQLKYLSLLVLKQELPKLLPVIVATLSQVQEKKESDLLSSLDALGLLFESQNGNVAAQHLSTIIPKLTEMASEHNSMKIRIAALRCLHEIPSLPTATVLLHTTDVLRALKPCLDDRKRLVRKEATRTACRWHLVGQEPE